MPARGGEAEEGDQPAGDFRAVDDAPGGGFEDVEVALGGTS